ncbi:hypothetical protein OS493_030394 [Desmophyllum pertusum]|uniref:Uncharacterized protein n=1 Tax=Desmophyllum pertusum TaxID=174260 RepID=A0A9W9ZA05_9CNID|nr:hypothetical protein OS493_030394 [Desmophyllum pertusum]
MFASSTISSSIVVTSTACNSSFIIPKWTTQFESQPYEVVDKCGNSVLVESPNGVQYKRNTTHVKSYHERDNAEQLPEEASTPLEEEDGRQVTVNQGDMEQSQKDEPKQMLEDVPTLRSPQPVCMRYLMTMLWDKLL